MPYVPTHVMIRRSDLDPGCNWHSETMSMVELDKVLPVIASEYTRYNGVNRLHVRVPAADGYRGGWWVGFDSPCHQGEQYGYAIDMSMPHLHED